MARRKHTPAAADALDQAERLVKETEVKTKLKLIASLAADVLESYHPNTVIVINTQGAEVLEGAAAVPMRKLWIND